MKTERKTDAAPATVDGTVVSVVFRNDETGYSVLRVEPSSGENRFKLKAAETIVVGTCGAVWEGEELHAEGEWVDDAVHGRQFKAKSIVCIAPKSAEGIRRYLASGLIKGIGREYAKRIVDRFGADTIDVLDHHSGRLREVKGIAAGRIAKIQASWRAERGTREVMIFTQTYGISVAKTAKIYRTYGPDSIAIIKRDPYRLCRDIWGIGFATADRIALSIGMPEDAPERARAAILHTLNTEAEDGGHCRTPEPDLLLHAQELVGISVEKLTDALKEEIAAGRVVAEGGDVALRELVNAEKRTAAALARLIRTRPGFAPIDPDRAIAWWEKKTGFSLAPAQLLAVRTSLSGKVSVVTGGPGVGKTTIIRALVEIWRAKHLDVRLAAPTGRAAKRMTESIYGVRPPPRPGAAPEAAPTPAQTVHRLLKYNPQTRAFTFNAENPLPGDVFVFDEMSMVDIRLMADLVSALPSAAHVVFVGDTDQLPSVGPGNVLQDLIASGVVPTSRLTEIFRQDATGLIVRNAHRVNAGEMFETRAGDTDFYFVTQEDPEKALALALDFASNRIPRRFRFDPMRDVQVLTPMRRNTLGTENLNRALQARLNPHGAGLPRGGIEFRVGDRVMQLRNNYDKDVYNGDVGFVRAADAAERALTVDFDGRPVEYRSGDLDELAPAYAVTIHKSQGSEYPAVIVLVHKQHYMMLQRNLLYTAITRGRKLVLVIGSPWAVKKAVETNVVRERRTALAERLKAADI